MYTSKLTSKFAEIIDSNTIVSPVPNSEGFVEGETLTNNPISVDILYEKEFLFSINFIFDNESQEYASLEYLANKEKKSFDFTLYNISEAQRPIAPPSAIKLARGNNISTFYLSFIVIPSPYAVQLSYTVYLVEEDEK